MISGQLIGSIVSIVSIIIAIIALIYSIVSNHDRYKLSTDLYYKVLDWHNRVVSVIMKFRYNCFESNKKELVAELSTLIEEGRFYLPSKDKNDNYGNEKQSAYQGRKNVALELLVCIIKIVNKSDYDPNNPDIRILQRRFTSCIFDGLKVREYRKLAAKYTDLLKDNYDIKDYIHLIYEKYK